MRWKLAKQQLLLARKAGLGRQKLNALASIARVLSVLGDYYHAIVDYYLQSIKLCEQLKYTDRLRINYLDISETYSDAGDYNNAIAYAYKGKSNNGYDKPGKYSGKYEKDDYLDLYRLKLMRNLANWTLLFLI
jgi:hypothetical protein